MVQTTNDYLGTTRDGFKVYDRVNSHIHLEHGITRELLKKAFKMMYANNSKFKKKEIHFCKPIGFNNCITTTSNDEIVMVYRKGRNGKTPMVKNRNPLPCNILTIIIKKDNDYENHYTLVTCFVGGGAEKEPWDTSISSDEERKKCEEFWNTHAMVYDPNIIDWDRM